MKSPEQFTRSDDASTPVSPSLRSLKVERRPHDADDDCSVGEDNSSSCSSSSSQSSTMATALNQSDACSSATSLCGWCQKPGLKLFTLRTADGSKAFCSELCFTQCRRASFKKNKICNWCKHVRHTVNYVDYFDGKSQLQFCSTKCLGQYKMNILCREIEMIPPRVLQSIQGSSSPSESPVHAANAMDAAVVANTQFPVDLCTKRKACSQAEGGPVKHAERLRAQEKESSGKRSQDANLERSQVLTQDSTKRLKSHRKSGEDPKKCGDALQRGARTALHSNGHEHHLRAQQQQIHLQQLQQLQTRMSLIPEMMLRSLNGNLNGKQTAGQERSCGGRRGLALPPAAPLLPHHHHHLPPGLPPPPPLRNHHFPPFRPASLLQQHCSAGSSPTLQPDFVKPTRYSLKSEPSASSHQTSTRKQQSYPASRSIETPAAESAIPRIRSHAAGHPHPPPALIFPPQPPSLVVPMPVVLPFPVPIPIPLFFFQQKALDKIEQLALQLKRESRVREDSHSEVQDKSTQVD